MKQSAIVRSFVAQDRPALERLWSEVFPDDPPANNPAGLIDRKLLVQPELILVAERNAVLVGAIMAGFDGVRGWLHHLAVAKSHRRQGIARLLVQTAESELKRLGCPKVNLQVRATNASVVAFYQSLGYSVEERISMGRRLTD